MENADHIVKAICVLHNVKIDLEKNVVTTNYTDSNTSSQINNLPRDLTVCVRNNRTSREAENVRSNLSIFFPKINYKKCNFILSICVLVLYTIYS